LELFLKMRKKRCIYHEELKCLSQTYTNVTILMGFLQEWKGRRGRDPMVVGFITTYAISAYHHVVSLNPVQARFIQYNIM